jgi:hypothetical protein
MKPCVRSRSVVYSGTRIPRAPSVVVRRVYQQEVGPIPPGNHVHHTCGNGWCIEPSHLEAVTPTQHRDAHRYNGLALGFNETAFG